MPFSRGGECEEGVEWKPVSFVSQPERKVQNISIELIKLYRLYCNIEHELLSFGKEQHDAISFRLLPLKTKQVESLN